MATNKESIRIRIDELDNSTGKKVQEIAKPFFVDLTAGLVGWLVGRVLGKKSLLVGGLTYMGGHYHGYYQAIQREKERQGMLDEQEKNAKYRFHKSEPITERIYFGNSPLISLGLGMIVGGQGSYGLNGVANTGTLLERAKAEFSTIANDLKHRAFLSLNSDQKEQEQTKIEQEKAVDGLPYLVAKDEASKQLGLSELDLLDEMMVKKADEFQQGISSDYTPAQAKAQPIEKATGINGVHVRFPTFVGGRIP